LVSEESVSVGHRRHPPRESAAVLSLTAEDIRIDEHEPQVLSVGLPFLVVELASRDTLRRARPNRSAYDRVLPLDGARSVYAYTRATAERPSEAGPDIHARMFTPRMTEDPASGSATAATAALLAEISDFPDGALILRFAQGVDMGRSSLLVARVLKRAGTARSVYVGGRCVKVMQGSLFLPGAT
jgi:trans-2,3-dihydro-3-hydroxyanthranilate isomerase